MKFETRTEKDGKVVLKLGLTHEMGFSPELNVEEVVVGVTALIEAVADISVFELTQAVINEYAKKAPANENDSPEETEQPVS